MVPEVNCFGTDARFHHVGIAVSSIQSVCPEAEVFTDSIQEVSVAFVLLNGVNVKLIEPFTEHSRIKLSLQKGVKFLHRRYEVSNPDGALEECRKHGFTCIAAPVSAGPFGGRKIAGVYSKQYGFSELLERG